MNRIFTSCFLLIVLFSPEMFPCTIFSLNKEEELSFAGNNCDCADIAYDHCLIEPGNESKYGALYFGSIKDKQCGMNERGLFYADASIPKWPIKQFRNDCAIDIRVKLMQECATVEEALDLFKRYGRERIFSCIHMLVVDSSGKSVVFEWDGEKLEAICKKGNYQIMTNFPLFERDAGRNPSLSREGQGQDKKNVEKSLAVEEPPPYQGGVLQIEDESTITCWRYLNAKKVLDSHPVTIKTCPLVLDWTHQEDPLWLTLFSVVGDLKRGVVYLYFNHNFNDVAILNICDELKKGRKAIKISSLFKEKMPESSRLKAIINING